MEILVNQNDFFFSHIFSHDFVIYTYHTGIAVSRILLRHA